MRGNKKGVINKHIEGNNKERPKKKQLWLTVKLSHGFEVKLT